MILIRAGRVLGPAEGLDLKADVVLDGDRIAGIFPADQGGAEGAPGFSPRERTYRQIIEAEGLWFDVRNQLFQRLIRNLTCNSGVRHFLFGFCIAKLLYNISCPGHFNLTS